jgi:hypothetical protein
MPNNASHGKLVLISAQHLFADFFTFTIASGPMFVYSICRPYNTIYYVITSTTADYNSVIINVLFSHMESAYDLEQRIRVHEQEKAHPAANTTVAKSGEDGL